jgi:hypothetical protein
MPSATPNTTTRTGAAASPSLDAEPELASGDRAAGGGNAPLAELAQRAAAAVTDALDQLVVLQSELRAVVAIVARRPWSDDERREYRILARQERDAYRRSVATRGWFDDVRARIDEQAR